MILIDNECSLKPLTAEDAEAIFSLLDREREYMRVWLPFVDSTKGIEDSRNAIRELTKGIDKQFAIIYRSQTVGLIGFKDTSIIDNSTEIGYWLSQDVQGRGVMTQSVVALLDLAFNEMQMNRVVIKVAVGNMKSQRIPEKLNFYLEGVEREGELLVDGLYADIAVYSLLKKEYIENKR